MLLEIVAIIVTYSTTKPGRWLLLLAILGELLTTLPLGVMTAVVFLPLLTRRFIRRTWLAASFILQMALVLGISWMYGR